MRLGCRVARVRAPAVAAIDSTAMCLIAIAHRASERYPLVIAANRDEDYERPTLDAHVWADAPDVIGGRDAVHGGAWLAVTRSGRFAAVTNLRGAEARVRSRGFLVRDFVTTAVDVRTYSSAIGHDAAEYAGFHLLAGEAGGEAMYIAPEEQHELAPGVHGLSNAPRGEQWPKTAIAAQRLQSALHATNVDVLLDELMQFLCTPRGSDSVESEVFIRGDRYGTRSSAVIVVTMGGTLFAEQSYARGGTVQGERRTMRLPR